jgi:hypothetical protein
MRNQIRRAKKEFYAEDYANRSLQLKDRVKNISAILERDSHEVADKKVRNYLIQGVLIKLLCLGVMIAGLYFLRDFVPDVPKYCEEILLGVIVVFVVLWLHPPHFKCRSKPPEPIEIVD